MQILKTLLPLAIMVLEMTAKAIADKDPDDRGIDDEVAEAIVIALAKLRKYGVI